MARAAVTLALGGASVALLYLLWHRRRKVSAARNEPGDEEDGEVLEPGMIFTIEPMINSGRAETKILGDGWTAVTRDRSLSAQFEHSSA